MSAQALDDSIAMANGINTNTAQASTNATNNAQSMANGVNAATSSMNIDAVNQALSFDDILVDIDSDFRIIGEVVGKYSEK